MERASRHMSLNVGDELELIFQLDCRNKIESLKRLT
jgi:hypothetical protein